MTIMQKQCLLAYLGYYTGPVDGQWGPKSQGATEAFQRDYRLTVDGDFGDATAQRIREVVYNQEAPAINTFWKDIHYFDREEFRCRCGGKYCNGFPAEPDEALVRLAEGIRGHFGRPVHCSSGLRCKTWNALCGGVSNSRHLAGKALDFCVEGRTAAQVLPYLGTLPGVRYAYAIDDTYIHMDVE